MNLETIKTFADLDEDKFAWFASNRELTYALLDRLAAICQPHSGAEKIILFLARIALGSSWLDGGLRVDVRFTGIPFRCQIAMLRDLGGEYEVLKRAELNASYTEFLKLKDDRGIKPFKVREETAGSNRTLIFSAPEAVRRSSLPPPEYQAAQSRMAAKLAGLGMPKVPRDLPRMNPKVQAALDRQRIKPKTQENAAPAKPEPKSASQPAAAPPPAKLKLGSAARNRTLTYGVPTPPIADIDDGWDDEPATKKKK